MSTYQGNSTPTVYLGRSRAPLYKRRFRAARVFNGTVNIFATVSNLVTAVQSGNQSGIATAAQQLQTFSDNASAASSQVGGLLNMAQSLQSQFSNQQGLTITSDLSNLQDADTTTAITNLDEAQNRPGGHIGSGCQGFLN